MKTLLLLLITFTSTPLFAECLYNDEYYPEGTIVNGYICTADGTWAYRSG